MDCTNYTDEQLAIQSSQQMDLFACLFDRYQKKLLRYIMRISSFRMEEAEEILQESFIKAWSNIHDFDDQYTFSSWIYRIVHNTTISQWKKSKSFGKDKQVRVEDQMLSNQPDNTDIAAEADKSLNEDQLHSVLNTLSEKYREVLILQYLEEKSYEEISDILQKPLGTIATRISRAKKAFKQAAQKQAVQFDID